MIDFILCEDRILDPVQVNEKMYNVSKCILFDSIYDWKELIRFLANGKCETFDVLLKNYIKV